jgi:hypothetical protein
MLHQVLPWTTYSPLRPAALARLPRHLLRSGHPNQTPIAAFQYNTTLSQRTEFLTSIFSGN